MGVTVLQPATSTPTPGHKVHRALPKLPKVPIGSKAPKVQRILPNVPNSKPSSVITTNGAKASRLLPKVPAPPAHPQSHVNAKNIRLLQDTTKTNTVQKDITKVHPRVLPKIPNSVTNVKPERDRKSYMHDIYKNEGDTLFNKGKFEEAMDSYNAALKMASDSKSALVARSKCYQSLGKRRRAMIDAESSLNLDPLYPEALYQKAELLFDQGNYEKALVFYHRGSKQRPDMVGFQHGMAKSQQALDDSNNGRKRKMTAAGDISIFASSKKKEGKKTSGVISPRSMGSNESPTPVSLRHVKPSVKTTKGKMKENKKDIHSINPNNAGFREHPEHNQIDESKINNTTMKNILGRMYRDKQYLEKLTRNEENTHSSVDLQAIAEDGLTFLYDRVLYWVRQGQTLPADGQNIPSFEPIRSINPPISPEMRSNESEKNARKKKKEADDKDHMQPSSWFRYLERRKAAEAAERKANRHKFITVVEGQKMPLSDGSDHGRKVLEPIKTKEKKIRSDKRTKRSKREKDANETMETADSALNFSFSSHRISTDIEGATPRRQRVAKTETVENDKAPPKKLWKYMKKEKRPTVSPEISRREMIDNYVSREMEDIEIAYADRQPEECTKRARAMLKTIETLSEEDLPNLFMVAAKLHSYMGNAAIELKEFDVALHHHRTDLEIGEKCNLDEIISRALGNLGRIFVFQNRHREALHMYLRKVPLCKTRIESAWLFHEIGNCYLVLGEYEYAKEAARRSLEEAEEAVEWSYQLQACVLMGVSEVKLKQYHAAFNTFERALDQAKVQGDTQAEMAIHEALKDVNDRIAEEIRSKAQEYHRPSRGDLAKSRAEFSDYSSIFIPEDDGDVSLTETGYDTDNLNLDLDQLRQDVETSCFGSTTVPSDYRHSRYTVRSDRRQSTMPLSGRANIPRSNTEFQ